MLKALLRKLRNIYWERFTRPKMEGYFRFQSTEGVMTREQAQEIFRKADKIFEKMDKAFDEMDELWKELRKDLKRKRSNGPNTDSEDL